MSFENVDIVTESLGQKLLEKSQELVVVADQEGYASLACLRELPMGTTRSRGKVTSGI